MKTVYILYSCDRWKHKHSMAIRAILTTLPKLRNAVRHEWIKEDMEFGDGFGMDDVSTVNQINTALIFGHVEEVDVDVIDNFSVTG